MMFFVPPLFSVRNAAPADALPAGRRGLVTCFALLKRPVASHLPAHQGRGDSEDPFMILDFILDAVGSLLEFAFSGWRRPPRRRVKRAVRLARKRRLTTKRRDYATGWLAFGLENLADLRLESRELEIRNALDTVSRQARR